MLQPLIMAISARRMKEFALFCCMLSAAQIKYIRKLRQKKYREQNRLFIAEGKRSISDLLNSSLQLHSIYATPEWTLPAGFAKDRLSIVPEKVMQQISGMDDAQEVLAIFKMPDFDLPENVSGLNLALDAVRDPGNLGTLIRTADWFGIHHIFCSKDCVDVYNPKVVRASMGSLGKVMVHYIDLAAWLKKQQLPVYSLMLEGDDLFSFSIPEECILIVGNEAHGVSEAVLKSSAGQLTIPSSGKAESLNAAIAGSIACAIYASQHKHLK